MLTREAIASLLPHGGASLLLDRALTWSGDEIVCEADSHLDPGNPYRRDGMLAIVCGIEYGLQAAGLHGALSGDGRGDTIGVLASVRDVRCVAERLDAPGIGTLRIVARCLGSAANGASYAFELTGGGGEPLLSARGTVMQVPAAGGGA